MEPNCEPDEKEAQTEQEERQGGYPVKGSDDPEGGDRTGRESSEGMERE